jgi:hypothetical protein
MELCVTGFGMREQKFTDVQKLDIVYTKLARPFTKSVGETNVLILHCYRSELNDKS